MPTRRPWVDPVPTTHLFYATPTAGAREIVIEARDPRFNLANTKALLEQAGGKAIAELEA